MGKESLWKGKFGAWFFTALGGFPVKRGTADREALRACLEVLERGEPLVMFPEGHPPARPRRPGVVRRRRVPGLPDRRPIVPVGLGGTEAAMPKGSKFVHPVRMTIVIGEPLVPPPSDGRISRKAIKALTAELADRIQVLFDEAQDLAGRPNVHTIARDQDDSGNQGAGA